jgi:hypothetical protein
MFASWLGLTTTLFSLSFRYVASPESVASCNCGVESHKVVPTHFPASLTKSCRSNSEHTQAVARQLTRRGELIDRSARTAELLAHPSTRLS